MPHLPGPSTRRAGTAPPAGPPAATGPGRLVPSGRLAPTGGRDTGAARPAAGPPGSRGPGRLPPPRRHPPSHRIELPAVLNTLKAVALLSFLAGVLVVAGTLLGGRTGLVIGALLGLGLVGGSWWFSAQVAIRAAGARPLPPGEAPELTRMVDDLADDAGIPRPRLYLSPSPQPNAFATGRNPDHAVVAVTQGLIELVPPEEIRGVLAHELGHVRNRDILLTSIAAALATGLSVIANMAAFGMLFGGHDEDDEGPGLLGTLALLIIAPLAGTLLQLALSRSREYEADRTGAELLGGDGEPLARALVRIDAHVHAQPMEIAPSQAQAWIVNPLAGTEALTRLFSTHPPLRERVARLRTRRA